MTAITIGITLGALLGYWLGRYRASAQWSARVAEVQRWKKAAQEERDDAIEKWSIADGAYAACRAELDRIKGVRSDAGRKAAVTRKARAVTGDGTGRALPPFSNTVQVSEPIPAHIEAINDA